jgi:hypothetical protein
LQLQTLTIYIPSESYFAMKLLIPRQCNPLPKANFLSERSFVVRKKRLREPYPRLKERRLSVTFRIATVQSLSDLMISMTKKHPREPNQKQRGTSPSARSFVETVKNPSC